MEEEGLGLEAPLLLPAGVVDPLATGDLASSGLAGWSCCAANEDRVAGEAICLATSSDCGLFLGENDGIENVRAIAAKEGNEEEVEDPEGSCEVDEFAESRLGEMDTVSCGGSSFAGEGVVGGGG